MSIFRIFLISLAAMFAENVVFVNYLGIKPFLESGKDRKKIAATGTSIIVASVICSLFTSTLDMFVLKPLEIGYLRTVSFVLVIALMLRALSALKTKIDISLSYALSSTVVLGISLLVSSAELNPLEAVIYAAATGASFLISSFIFSEVSKKLEYASVPKFFKGLPILLITAGLIALAFSGFIGMKFI